MRGTFHRRVIQDFEKVCCCCCMSSRSGAARPAPQLRASQERALLKRIPDSRSGSTVQPDFGHAVDAPTDAAAPAPAPTVPPVGKRWRCEVRVDAGSAAVSAGDAAGAGAPPHANEARRVVPGRSGSGAALAAWATGSALTVADAAPLASNAPGAGVLRCGLASRSFVDEQAISLTTMAGRHGPQTRALRPALRGWADDDAYLALAGKARGGPATRGVSVRTARHESSRACRGKSRLLWR